MEDAEEPQPASASSRERGRERSGAAAGLGPLGHLRAQALAGYEAVTPPAGGPYDAPDADPGPGPL